MRVETGVSVGVLAPDDNSSDGKARLQRRRLFQLGAPLAQWTEQWTLIPSNFWHVDYDGIAPMKLAVGAVRRTAFHPLAGDTLRAALATDTGPRRNDHRRTRRSDGVARRPGTAQHARLDCSAARAATYLSACRKTRRSSASRSTVGRNRFRRSATFAATGSTRSQQARSRGKHPSPPDVDSHQRNRIAGRAYNIALNLSLPTDRWPLFVGGPRLGSGRLVLGRDARRHWGGAGRSREYPPYRSRRSTACCSGSA